MVSNAHMNKTSSSATLPDDALLRQKELLRIVPISPATLWRRVGDGSFPKPFRLSPRVVAWRIGTVRQWLLQQQRGVA